MPQRHLSRKVPLAVNAPLHLIPPHALMVSQTPEAPYTHGHRIVPTTFTHDIDQFRRRHDVRLDFIASLRPLLVRIRVPDKTGFAPGRAEEAESEPAACRCQ